MSLSVSTAPARTVSPAWIGLALGAAALVAMFWPECSAAVRVWIDSTAYGHCFLVAPIAAYLIYERRESLQGLTPQPVPALALLALPLPLAWFFAERLGIMEGRQLVALTAFQVLCLTMLGPRLFLAVVGPLLYLYFLVPFGAFVTPALQSFTAWFIDAGLTVLNVTHEMNDMTIEVRSGTFFVAEACAGLRFLIASIAFGVFFALLNYRSPGRRTLFMLASIAIPIIANGCRALGIVLLGNLLGSAQAAAADHLIYGWVFFSVVMLLLVAAGLPFRETPAPAPAAATLPPRGNDGGWGRAWAALPVLLCAVLGPAAAMALGTIAAPARLVDTPRLVAPEGCTLEGQPRTAADRAQIRLDCDGRVWDVDVQVLPNRVTGGALGQARGAMLGDIDTEDLDTKAMVGVPGWQVSVLRQPLQITGVGTYVDGAPARGGLNQRIALARNSLTGTAPQPVVIGITHRPGRTVSDAELQLIVGQLQRFVMAQPDLAEESERLSGR